MTQTNLQAFSFTGSEVRIVKGDDGEPRFVAKDIVEAVGTIWKGDAGSLAFIPDEWKGLLSVQTPGGIQQMQCLTESGVYFYLNRSDKPKALPFQKWLAGEVLPSIRKHGMFATASTVEAMLNDPDTTIRILQELKKERQARIEAQERIEADAPKVAFHDAVASSTTDILINEMSKLLQRSEHKGMKPQTFRKWLLDNKYLCKRDGQNAPTQAAIDNGWLSVKEAVVIDRWTGRHICNITPMVTPKGQQYFIRKLDKEA